MCVCGTCQWVVIRHHVRSGLLRQDRQLGVQVLSVAISAPGSVLLVLPSWHSRNGMGRLNISFHDLDRTDTGPVLQTGCWSRDEYGIFGFDWCIDTGSFNDATSSTKWCSPAGIPRCSSEELSCAEQTLSARDRKLRVRDPPDSRDCYLLMMQRLRTNQLRGEPHRRRCASPAAVHELISAHCPHQPSEETS